MKITIENTTKTVELNGVPARIWEGTTECGIKVHCFITRFVIDANEPLTDEFIRELQEVKAPTAEIEAYPWRLIL